MYTHLQERFAPRPPVNISTLNKMKADCQKIACVTAYDASFAALCCPRCQSMMARSGVLRRAEYLAAQGFRWTEGE